MSKEVFGDVCAYIPGKTPDDKNRYPKIGLAFKDERGQISIKIDTLPIQNSRWEGWVNIFPPKDTRPKRDTSPGGEDEPF